jgi:hypothetical protein
MNHAADLLSACQDPIAERARDVPPGSHSLMCVAQGMEYLSDDSSSGNYSCSSAVGLLDVVESPHRCGALRPVVFHHHAASD